MGKRWWGPSALKGMGGAAPRTHGHTQDRKHMHTRRTRASLHTDTGPHRLPRTTRGQPSVLAVGTAPTQSSFRVPHSRRDDPTFLSPSLRHRGQELTPTWSAVSSKRRRAQGDLEKTLARLRTRSAVAVPLSPRVPGCRRWKGHSGQLRALDGGRLLRLLPSPPTGQGQGRRGALPSPAPTPAGPQRHPCCLYPPSSELTAPVHTPSDSTCRHGSSAHT